MPLPGTQPPTHSYRVLTARVIVLLALCFASNLTMLTSDHPTIAQTDTADAAVSTPQPGNITVTVMTFNTGDGLATPDDLVSFIRESGADLVALQEVTAEVAEALETDLADILPYQAVRGLGIPGKALLSSYPITHVEWLELNPGRPDLLATVDLAGHPIDVLVAHPPPPELNAGIVQPREGTYEHFDRIVEIAAEAENPFLLVGDLNEVSLQSRHGELESIGLQDVFDAVGSGDGSTYPNRIPPLPDALIEPILRIDYIWASEEWLPLSATVGEDVGSDHLAVIADLALLNESAVVDGEFEVHVHLPTWR